uniref:NADH-ubiquinone oxidoreductase chain 6 n=1 Tax=Psolodesmus mandarinus TaxID=193280 RepID=A0A4P2SJP0_9ODON|nr:NADH dehydrogenase subunit 6 [Psolodesmus mandarinus]AWH61867.1 NADH dehydrogenase subunit 6 [Psolodesmus mandarinus]
MSQMILCFLALCGAIGFCKMKHPASTGIVLMIQTVLISLITNNFSQNAWFSYMLFLVFLGGMLVLFIYLTSVASNELFTSSYKWMSTMITLTVMMPALLMMEPLMLSNNTPDNEEMMIDKEMMSSLFNYPYSLMTMAVILYLLLTLVVVVKITESHSGPLRSNS